MEDYQISEADIVAVMRYLKDHNPENADRDYALQLLQSMQGVAHDIARDSNVDIEALQNYLKEN